MYHVSIFVNKTSLELDPERHTTCTHVLYLPACT